MDGQQRPPALPAGTAVVTMPGEVDHGNAAQVGDELAAAFAPGITTVIADFTPTVFCDSSAIREIVLARERATAANTAVRVVVPPGHLMTFLTRTGAAGYLSIHPSLGAALAAGPPPGHAAPGGP